jgi:hypothetical protein
MRLAGGLHGNVIVLAARPQERPAKLISATEEAAMTSSMRSGPVVVDHHASPRSSPGWRKVNITPAERAGRIVIGVAVIIAGIILLVGAASPLATAFEVLLVAVGLDLAVTGALGHCPLYAKLGYQPQSLRSLP